MLTLNAVEVHHWRGLEHERLDNLSKGLNIIAGPNESGKSRLVQAIRYGLFEPTQGKSQTVKQLLSWSGNKQPEVMIHFQIGSESYSVEKRFLRQAHTTLKGPGESFSDKEAELKLRNLLGLSDNTGRGFTRIKKPELLGHWPLLWLEQEQVTRAPHEDLHENINSRLQSLLTRETGEVLDGALGQKILERVRQEARNYWTPGTRKPTGQLIQAMVDHQQALENKQAAASQLEKFHDTARQLDALRITKTELVDRLQQRVLKEKEVRQQIEHAAKTHAQLENQAERIKTLNAELKAVDQNIQDHAANKKSFDKALADQQKFEIALTNANQQLRDLSEKRSAIEKEISALETQQKTLDIQLQNAIKQETERKQAEQRNALQDKLQQANQYQSALQQARAKLAAIKLDGKTWKQILDAEKELDRARVRLDAASVEVTLTAYQDLTLKDGTTLNTGESRPFLIAERTALDIPDQLSIDINPGSQALPKLRDAFQDAERNLETILSANDCDTIEAANQRHIETENLNRDISNLENSRDRIAPEGISVLSEQLDKLPQTIAEYDETLDSAEQINTTASDNRLNLKNKRQAREKIVKQIQKVELTQSQNSSDKKHNQHTIEGLQVRIESLPELTALQKEQQQLQQKTQETLALQAQLKQTYQKLGGDTLKTDLEREQESIQDLKHQQLELRDQETEARTLLEQHQALDLYGKKQEADSTEAQAKQNLQRIQKKADAARLLLDTLEQTRQETQQRLVKPVMDKVAPYLQLVFPNVQLGLSENLEVTGLVSEHQQESYDQLSAGAREQLSILVRLGLAEILSEGKRLPIILDDALAYSDKQRVENLNRALYQAGKLFQILLFSCREAQLDSLGGAKRYRLSGKRSY
ncbi:MAG: hypothetical protein HQL54_11265 [Magnetococcales bacterium]|nr:hypothetical protein [Magnetococcales bacterium]